MDQPEGEDGERLDVEGELALAQALIAAGDYSRGVCHLGFAAAVDPTHPGVASLLDRVATHMGELAPDTVEHVRPGELWTGETAVRAWLLRRVGRRDEAVVLLLQLIGADPQRRWSAWLVGWIDEDPELPLPADAVVATCGRLLQPLLHAEPTDEVRATLVDVAGIVEAAIAGASDHGWLRSIGSGVARRVDRHGDAVQWAEEGDRLAPSVVSGCMLGYAYRAAGDQRQAFEAFARASQRDRADPDPRLDAADSLAVVGAWHEAAGWGSQPGNSTPTEAPPPPGRSIAATAIPTIRRRSWSCWTGWRTGSATMATCPRPSGTHRRSPAPAPLSSPGAATSPSPATRLSASPASSTPSCTLTRRHPPEPSRPSSARR